MLFDSTASQSMVSFMDDFIDYNQIKTGSSNAEKTAYEPPWTISIAQS